MVRCHSPSTAIRNAKIAAKLYKLPKEQGLFLSVNPNDSKPWRLAYTFYGKEKLFLGRYPEITLKAARERRDEARRLLATASTRRSIVSRRKRGKL
jgi:hypothetical protein